jgi:hypothetical protein
MRRAIPLAALTLAVSLSVGDAVAGPAPRELYNKTIVLGWNEQIQERTPDGRILQTALTHQGIVYISNAGRFFVRNTRSVGGQAAASKNFERGPDNMRSASGDLDFRGNQLVGTGVVGGFARRVTVSFGAGFSSCSATAVYGNSGRIGTTKTLDDAKVHAILSISASGASFSIREGNPFAK